MRTTDIPPSTAHEKSSEAGDGSAALSWYERTAPFYDAAMLGDLFYRAARRRAVAELAPQPQETCFVFFCGTGLDFPLLAAGLERRGRVVGLDGSPAMLRRASKRAAALPATEDLAIELVHADFAMPEGIGTAVEEIRRLSPGCILFSLGLTCLSNWREFFLATFDAAPSSTRFAVLDVHAEPSNRGKWVIDWIAAADTSRPVWQALGAHAASYRQHLFRPFKLIDATVFVAAGVKG